MRYCPLSSLTTVRTRSMSASLDASTVTPGSTAPDESFTTPAIADCARAAVGSSNIQVNTSNVFAKKRGSGLRVCMAALPAATTGMLADVVFDQYSPAWMEPREKSACGERIERTHAEGETPRLWEEHRRSHQRRLRRSRRASMPTTP